MWNVMYGHLRQYKNKYHSTSVLKTFKDEDGCRLGEWVSNQRQAYKNKSLSAEKINRLNSIGFVWKPHDANWTEKYERLVKYKKQNKTTCVPWGYPADPQLAIWVSTQRVRCNKLDRIAQLDLIGFVWKIKDK